MNCITKCCIRKVKEAVQWLGLRTFTVEGMGSILVRELKSCMPCSVAKKKSERIHKNITFYQISHETKNIVVSITILEELRCMLSPLPILKDYHFC